MNLEATSLNNNQDPVLVIVGPTGSGKTGLAIEIALELAKRRGVDCAAEIISADSRAIYRGMDIGTAKPDAEEMRGVPHHGFDLVGPGERFTVVDFKKYAEKKISEIQSRGRMAIIAGGTGLYVDALVYDYQFGDVVKKTCSDREQIRDGFVMFGLRWDRGELRERLQMRADKMFEQAIVEETKKVYEMYPEDCQALKSNIYQFVRDYLNNEITQEEAKRLFVLDDWHLAKRQLTWFKRNEHIQWVSLSEAKERIMNTIS